MNTPRVISYENPEVRGYIPKEVISTYGVAFQKVIDELAPAKNWRQAYIEFAKAWNATTKGNILPHKTSGMGGVFQKYRLAPQDQETLEVSLRISLNIRPEDEGNDDEGDDAITTTPTRRHWINMTSAKTQQEIADIIRFPKKEKDGEEISLYIRFRECFEENFGAEYKKYLPYIEELIFNKKRNRIEVSQKYRERMQHLFRNTTIQERVLGIIMDFQLYEESPYTPLLTTHPTTK